MRFSKIILLGFALLLLCVGNANAFLAGGVAPYNITMTSAYAGADLDPSDSVIVDLYLDASPGLGFLTVALTYENDGTLSYNPSGSSMPSYILYTGGKGATYMIPNVNPPNYWNGINLPGKRQVNVEYLEFALGSATASGTGIWIASVAFHVETETASTNTIELTLAGNGTIVEQYTVDVKGATTLTNTSLVLNLPEPTSAMMAVGAVAALAAIRTRRRR